MNTVSVELRPHIGKNYNKKLDTVVEIEHDQFVVMASINGGPMIQVGYVGKTEGSPLNGIDTLRALPAAVQEQIREEVVKAKGGAPVKMYVPASPSPLLTEEDD